MVVKPAVDKLPLVTRKNLRDNWDAKKAEYEKDLSEALGGSWTITFEPALIYSNIQTDRKDMLDRIADGITWYVTALISNAQRWVKDFGPEGLAELDALCSKHTVHIAPQEDTAFTYGGVVLKDGIFHLVYAENNFVTNVDNVSAPEVITDAIKQAGKDGVEGANPSKLNVESRMNIRKYWDAKQEETRKEIADAVKIDDIVLEPQFEEMANALTSVPRPKDKNEQYRYDRDQKEMLSLIGGTSLNYFKAFAEQLSRDKFDEDDMLQEAFQEAITAKKVGLRVVDKLQKKNYCELVIEDGVMWMQTTPKEWRVNIDRVAEDLLNLF